MPPRRTRGSRHDSLTLRLLKEVNDIKSALRHVVVNLPLYDIGNENTPAQITANQNNYVVGNYDVLRLSTDADRNITGLRGGVKGRQIRIFNIGSSAISLIHQNAGSDPANRFKFSNGLTTIIAPNSTVLLYYDSTQSRWIGGDTYSSGAVFALIENTNNQSIQSGFQGAVDPGTVIQDQYGLYDDANNNILIPFGGIYHTVLHVKWAGEVAAVGYFRECRIDSRFLGGLAKSKSNSVITQDTAANTMEHEVSETDEYAAGDYIDFFAAQNSPTASNLNITLARVIVTRIT